MSNISDKFTYLIAGWAGFYVMAIEMLGARILAPYFGSGVYVWGAVITTFMLGLSGGYLVGGHLSTKEPTLKRLGILLLFSVVSVVPLLFNNEAILGMIFYSIDDPRLSALLGSVMLFLLPTFTLGTISPYCVRLIANTLALSGQVAGRLYFVSTLGSTLGTLLTSFYLVLLLELNQLLFGLTAITVMIGTMAVLFNNTFTRKS